MGGLAGYIASSFVFLTFYMKDMISLRVVALCSNLAFLVYAGALHLAPIFILHTALIPIDARRLFCAVRQRKLANKEIYSTSLAHTRELPTRPR